MESIYDEMSVILIMKGICCSLGYYVNYQKYFKKIKGNFSISPLRLIQSNSQFSDISQKTRQEDLCFKIGTCFKNIK